MHDKTTEDFYWIDVYKRQVQENAPKPWTVDDDVWWWHKMCCDRSPYNAEQV